MIYQITQVILMANDIKKLLNSLQKQPNFSIMHFSENEQFINEIKEFCKDECSEYRVISFDKNNLIKLNKYSDNITKIQYLDPLKKKYSMHGKFYDYIFVNSLYKDRETFFKRVYSALKNGALMFIFLEKNKREKAYKIESELIENNYVATSLIDLDEYLIISAKKMHGWGS